MGPTPRTRRAWAPALVALLGACAPPPPVPATGSSPLHYDDPRAWLCLPGRADACSGDLGATVVHPDGTRSLDSSPPATEPRVDCFYVYPTVDVGMAPGNHEDFRDLGPMGRTALAQVGRLRDVCALYAPLYRQVTIGSYFREESLEPRLQVAFADVEAAFREYLARLDRGRPIVLVGHSQGADMIIRLMQRFFDHDAELRKRLLLALPIGWYVETPRGKTTGGTFENVPVCTSPDERGCVIAYRLHEAGSRIRLGHHAPRPGNVSVCVNPAAVGSDARVPFTRAYLTTQGTGRHYLNVQDVETPFLEMERFYEGQCVEGPDGYRYLAVSTAPDDRRDNPVAFARLPLHDFIALHVLDLQLPQGDVVDLVRRLALAR